MTGVHRGQRRLIVNADDFGQSSGINRGILYAHEHGVVTSASLMVRWADASAAAKAAHEAGLPLGLHVDLGEWVYRAGAWEAHYEVADLTDERGLTDEIRGQVATFIDLTGRTPTHVDSHQHVHRRPHVRAAIEEVVRPLRAVIREIDARVTYCGTFYGQTAEGDARPDAISTTALKAIIAELPEGVTELGCHPGFDVEVDTMYRSERAREVASLCDARVRQVIDAQGIELCSFEEL